MSTESVAQWERQLPQGRGRDAAWEAVLRVPPGWLRDPGIPTPALPNPAFDSGDAGRMSIAEFIHAYCVWHVSANPASRTLSFDALPAREQRMAAIMVRRYGSEGEERATLQAIGEDLGLTRERVRQIEEKAAALFAPVPAPPELARRLQAVLTPFLPCPVSPLPPPVQDLLGGGQSLEGADRFFREVLGERLVSVRSQTGTHAAHERLVVDDAAPDEALMRAVRQASLAMVRQAGAAQLFYVAGAVAAQGFAATPDQVAQCAHLFAGFEWLVEEEGWFWYGTAPDNRAKWTALKVLACANRAVDIEELYAAMARARFAKQSERGSPASVSVPMPVLQVLLARFPEIRISHYNDYRLAPQTPALEDPASVYLAPSELAIRDAIVRHGGVAARQVLVSELVGTGLVEKNSLSMALVSSPVFRRHDIGIWTLAGYSFSHEALGAAQHEKSLLQEVDGWFDVEVSLPRSAFERGDWFVPAAAHPHLTPGDYAIEGIGGPARYVINTVGSPYLKRFAHLVAAAGFETGVPYLFGISATQRLLRLQPLAVTSADAGMQ